MLFFQCFSSSLILPLLPLEKGESELTPGTMKSREVLDVGLFCCLGETVDPNFAIIYNRPLFVGS
ncbi:MAG: hypothetical protein DME24_24390 [Verrucomicrobia bacterium]|nr:MAG: hypothetical protein DME24_24390 [Verrucomicrobiota bacterium]